MPNTKLAPALQRNIQTLHERRLADEQAAAAPERFARWLAGVIGTVTFAAIHLAALIVWILIQTGLTPIRPFDPHFTAMISFASVECVFMTIFVLINQRTEARAADRRAELGLQIGLLSEHELTQLIALVAAIADKLGVEESQNPEIAHATKAVAPGHVLDELAAREQEREG